MLQSLADIGADLCKKWDCKLIEVNGEADHLHILFQYDPQLKLPKTLYRGAGSVGSDSVSLHHLGSHAMPSAGFANGSCAGLPAD
jgi:hypothetical protein